MIAILHLSFYIIYPSQKANLYFALFAITYCIASVTQFIFWLYPYGVGSKFYLGNLTFALFILGYVFLMKAAYLFLERKKDFFFQFLIVFSFVGVILNVWPYGFGWQIGGPIFELLVQINIARIAIIAEKTKRRLDYCRWRHKHANFFRDLLKSGETFHQYIFCDQLATHQDIHLCDAEH